MESLESPTALQTKWRMAVSGEVHHVGPVAALAPRDERRWGLWQSVVRILVRPGDSRGDV